MKSQMKLIFLPQKLNIEYFAEEDKHKYQVVLDEHGQALDQNHQVIFPNHDWTMLSDERIDHTILFANAFLSGGEHDEHNAQNEQEMIVPQAHPFIATQNVLVENQFFLNEAFQDPQEHNAHDQESTNALYEAANAHIARQAQQMEMQKQQDEEKQKRDREAENRAFDEYVHGGEEDLVPTENDDFLPDLVDGRSQLLSDMNMNNNNVENQHHKIVKDNSPNLLDENDELDLHKVLEEHAARCPMDEFSKNNDEATMNIDEQNTNANKEPTNDNELGETMNVDEQNTTANHSCTNEMSRNNDDVTMNEVINGVEQNVIANDDDVTMNGNEEIDATAEQAKSREEILKIVGQNGLELKGYDAWKNDFDIVCAAVRNNGLALEWAGIRLRYNREVAELAVKQNPEAIKFTSAFE